MSTPRLLSFCRVRRSALAATFAALLLAVTAFPVHAQVTGQAPAPTSSSSDVQTAQVVEAPKTIDKRDVAISAFGQLTNKTDGNFVRLDPTGSGGGMISYRNTPRWWFGYEFNYGNTRYSDVYNKGDYRVKHQANELTAAYLLKAPAYHGYSGFIGLGGGTMISSPSTYGGLLAPTAKLGSQAVPLYVFIIGVDHSFGQHFGVRLQYRDDISKAPNYKQVQLDAHKLRSSNEPAIGVYYRF
jgi:hypothetical protein